MASRLIILVCNSPVMIVKPVMVYSILPPSSPSKKTSSCIVPSLSVTFFIIFPGDMVATYSSTWSTFFQCFQKGLARREFEILLIVVSFRHQGFRPPHLQKMINSLLYRVELGSAPFEWHLVMMLMMVMTIRWYYDIYIMMMCRSVTFLFIPSWAPDVMMMFVSLIATLCSSTIRFSLESSSSGWQNFH